MTVNITRPSLIDPTGGILYFFGGLIMQLAPSATFVLVWLGLHWDRFDWSVSYDYWNVFGTLLGGISWSCLAVAIIMTSSYHFDRTVLEYCVMYLQPIVVALYFQSVARRSKRDRLRASIVVIGVIILNPIAVLGVMLLLLLIK